MDQEQGVVRSYGGTTTERATPGPRQKWYRLVSPRKDSHGTRFDPMGGDLTRHKKLGSPWLWGHASSHNALGDPPPPESVIGRVLEYDPHPEGFDVLVEHDEDKKNPLALCNRVWDRVERGLIRGCSVGAIPTERGEDPDGTPVFVKWTLVEGSSVIIPSNEDTVVLERDAAMAALDAMGTQEEPLLRPVTLIAEWTNVASRPAVQAPTERTALAPAPPPLVTALAEAVGLAEALATPALVTEAQQAVADAVHKGPSHRLKLRREVASVALHDADGRVLFGKRRDDGKWSLPGGHLEVAEPPLNGAVRELAEETGVRLPPERLSALGVGHVGEYVVHAFRADLSEDDGARTNPGADPDQEFGEFRWVAHPSAGESTTAEVMDNLHSPRNVTLYLLGWLGDDLGIRVDRPAAAQAAQVATAVGVIASRTAEPLAARVPPRDIAADPAAERAPAALVVELTAAETRGAVPHEEYPTVGGAWDAAAAVRRWARWASSDGSGDEGEVDWKKYAKCFAWYDASAPRSRGSYKLPHHDVRGGRPVTVWRGAVAAAAAVQGARGGTSIPADEVEEVRAHLAAHYREFGKRAPWEGEERGGGGMTTGEGIVLVGEARDVLELRGDYRGVAFALAPGVRDELRRGLVWHREGRGGARLVPSTICDARLLVGNGAWWPDKARAARAWFARHGAQGHPREGTNGEPTPYGVAWALWGGDPGRRQVAQVVAAMEADDGAARARALRGIGGEADAAELLRDLHAGGALYHTGVLDQQAPGAAEVPVSETARSVPTIGQVPAAVLTAAVVPHKEKREMLPAMTRECRMLHRGLIAHKLEGAEHHAEAYESLPAEHVAVRALHRDQAHHLLEQAGELHRAMKANFHPAKAGEEDDEDDEGEARTVPPFVKDEEMKRAFAATYASLGRVQSTPGLVCREALGEGAADPEKLRTTLVALVDDRADLTKLRAVAKRDARASEAQQREALIEQWSAPDVAVIDPARALTMRGHDPATYAPGAPPSRAPWTLAQIQRYVTERQASGPAVPIVRTAPVATIPGSGAPVPGALPLQPAAATGIYAPSGRVRAGVSDPSQRVNLAQAAQQLVREMSASPDPFQTAGVVRDLHGREVRRGAQGGADASAIAEVAERMARGELAFGRPDMSQLKPVDGADAGMRPV